MLKLGFSLGEVLAMSEADLDGYLEAYEELQPGKKPTKRKYLVRRKGS